MTEPTADFSSGIERQQRRASTRKATLRMRLQIETLTRALEEAKREDKTRRRRPGMTARELHHALARVGEPLADCRVALDLGGCYADVLSVRWGSDPDQFYVELELGPVRLRRAPP